MQEVRSKVAACASSSQVSTRKTHILDLFFRTISRWIFLSMLDVFSSVNLREIKITVPCYSTIRWLFFEKIGAKSGLRSLASSIYFLAIPKQNVTHEKPEGTRVFHRRDFESMSLRRGSASGNARYRKTSIGTGPTHVFMPFYLRCLVSLILRSCSNLLAQ